MSKRNFILLVIVLIIAVGAGLFYLSSYKQTGNGSTNSGTNFLSDFFPFGKSTTNTQNKKTDNSVDVSGYIAPPVEEVQISKLKKISNLPVAGYGVFMKEIFKDVPVVTPAPAETIVEPTTTKNKKKPVVKPIAPQTEFVTALRYVDRATGNIYQTFAEKLDERKFTITVVPQVYDAYFGNKSESVVMRYLKSDNKTIQTFVGALPKEILGGDMSGNNEIIGTFLPENISDLSISSDTSKIFYLFETNNTAVGVTSSYRGDSKVQMFSSPLTEWLSQWPSSNTITLTTKPSNAVPGYMYTTGPNKKGLTKVLSKINGLTTLTSPSGNLVLFGNNNLSLNIYNIENSQTTPVTIKTMPEKCVWNSSNTTIYCAVPKSINGGNYPDSWYQGVTSFNDEIWGIDAGTGTAALLLDPSGVPGGEEVDGIKLSLDEKENFLFFIDKKTSYLWEFKLN